MCGHTTLADEGVAPGSYAQAYVFDEVKGMLEKGMLLYFPDVLYVVAVPIGEVQALVLSPQRYPVPPVASRIQSDTFVEPSVVS